MERIPFLQWGDLRKNKKAILRFALAGEEAHLPIYLYVYLKEMYEYSLLKKKKISAKDLLELKKKFSKKFPSKEWLISEDQLDRAAFALFICNQKPKTKIYELGSTICNLKIKMDFLAKILNFRKKVQYVGIEKNNFLIFLARQFHKNQDITTELPHSLGNQKTLFISRYVSSYVFKKTQDFANYLKQFSYGYITEPFYFQKKDYITYNHGLKNIFFDFEKFFLILNNSHNLFVTTSFIDCPAGTDFCAVLNIILIKKSKNLDQLLKKLTNFGLKTRLLDSNYVNNLFQNTSKQELEHIKYCKSLNPVWGKSEAPFIQGSVAKAFKMFLHRRKKSNEYNFEFDNLFLSRASLMNELQKSKKG